ncbi:MAG: alpha/beta hydrolase [Pyrinomonadaceae bacterium]
MKKLLFLSFLFLCLFPGDCLAQPREGHLITPDKVKIFYKVVGSGSEVVIAVHGGPGNTMHSILADLEPLARNRTIVYYDQRGNGGSDLIRDQDKLSISKHISDLEAVRTYFKLDKVTLLGNSWGGMLISFYAAAHPDRVERLILHNPGEPSRELLFAAVDETQARIRSRYNEEQRKRWAFVSNPQTWLDAKDPRAICREFFTMILPTFVVREESISRFKGDVCAGPEAAVRQQQFVNMQVWRSLGDFNVQPSLARVKAPVLIIHGVADPIPVKSSEAWATGFPNARLLLIKEAGHLSHVETPEIFFPAVETFLKGEFPAQAKIVRRPN